jgi:phytoene synthase
MMQLFHTTCEHCSRTLTTAYSTSFSAAIRLLHKDLRPHVFNIYGFVRLADEIVDSFHEHDKTYLLSQFKSETYCAIETRINLNPILNSFQRTVNDFSIDRTLIESFFQSMEMDLTAKTYDQRSYGKYIYGSAEAVGLMCLHVFCQGKKGLYDELKTSARSLGAAFQKVNFLRDIKADYSELSRMYFPGCSFSGFTQAAKKEIENDIENDFQRALAGILKLPVKAKFGVYIAYRYYFSLYQRIKKMQPERILQERVRIPNYQKALLVLRAKINCRLGLLK